jgi:hypothetical protein
MGQLGANSLSHWPKVSPSNKGGDGDFCPPPSVVCTWTLGIQACTFRVQLLTAYESQQGYEGKTGQVALA